MQLRKNWKLGKLCGLVDGGKVFYWCNSERIESLPPMSLSPKIRSRMQLRKNWKPMPRADPASRGIGYNDATQKELKVVDLLEVHDRVFRRMQLRKNWKENVKGFTGLQEIAGCNSERIERHRRNPRQAESRKPMQLRKNWKWRLAVRRNTFDVYVRCNSERIESFSRASWRSPW